MSANAAASPQGKSGAAEPSMEEILASIRRIIADDSLGAKKDQAMPPPAAPVEPEPLVVEDADVLDLAEVATVASEPIEVDVMVEARPAPLKAPMPTPDDDLIAGMEPAPVVVDFTPAPKPAPLAPPRPVAKPVELPEAMEPAAGEKPSLENRILSEATGAMVGQAFQALSRNVAVPTGRTLEEIVVEIMRPMLKGWLDDNLPGIVERLVRNEIERVARGG